MQSAKKRKVAADGHGILSKKKRIIFEKEFSGLRELKSITVGPNITKLGIRAFSDCSEFTSVHMEEGLQEIGAYCFAGCPKLQDVVIPDSVQNVYSFAFADCPGLKSPVYNRSGTILYRYPDTLEAASCKLRPGVQTIASTAFMHNPHLKDVILPDSVTELAHQAFYESNIRSVTIPAGVKTIRAQTFVRCEQLEKVILLGNTRIEPNSFHGAPETLQFIRMNGKVRANEKYWAIGIPLLRGALCAPRDTFHTKSEAFWKLAQGCSEGDSDFMWKMGTYFAELFQVHGDLFYHRAEIFWRYFAYLWGDPKADRWFAQWEQTHAGERLTALLDEKRAGEGIDGSYFYNLGFRYFTPGVRYDIRPTDPFGLTLVQAYPYDGDSFESGHFQITYLDEYLNELPVASIYRHPDSKSDLGASDPVLSDIKVNAMRQSRRRNKERRKCNPYFITPDWL